MAGMSSTPQRNRTSSRLAAIAESATLAVDAKAKALKAAGENVIGFGAGEPDFPTPEHIVEAAVRACRDPKFHRYTPAAGLPELREAIAHRLRSRTREAWLQVFEGTDACVAPVLSVDDAASHPHAVQRQAFVNVGGVVQPAAAPRFDRTPSRIPRAAPEVGQDTQAILAEIGYSPEHIMLLRQQAAVK